MSEANKALVRRYLEAMNKRDLALINELFAPDFINHSPRIDRVGREETVQDYARFFTAFPDLRSPRLLSTLPEQKTR